eukprot:7382774-Prymnesium_polylepis.1
MFARLRALSRRSWSMQACATGGISRFRSSVSGATCAVLWADAFKSPRQMLPDCLVSGVLTSATTCCRPRQVVFEKCEDDSC